MDGIEDVVRTALRDNAALVTRESLRHSAPAARRAPRTRGAVLAAAVFVLAAGGITTAVTMVGDAPGQQWGVEGPGYAGHRWDLRGVDGRAVPGEVDASATFRADGSFQLSDGTNSMFGRYEGTASSMRLLDVGRTYALYTGDDPVRLAVIAAMNELTSRNAGVSVSGDRLVVTTGAHEMTFVRAGVASAVVPSSSR
ncbi:META domain-containing protein [Lentzea sp. NPDC058450]|uniref:META domain-containing protein n=1 Tax=Lentzea sp. NPDC058450 TaxID=3346505 RepID=UPI00365A51A5